MPTDPAARETSRTRAFKAAWMRRAALWVGVYLLLVAAPLVVLLTIPTPRGVEFWWDFSMALGFAGLAMMGIQFALTARFKRANAPFGADIVYLFHRYLAIIALVLVAGHFAILWVRYDDVLGSLDPRTAAWELTLGRIALVAFALAVITSQWRKLFRIRYEWWRHVHVVLAVVGMVAAAGHVVGAGRYTEAPLKGLLWLALTLGWLLLVVWVRVVKPARMKRQAYRVAEVREERGETWTLALEPVGEPAVTGFMPGQFAWLTVRHSPYALREHPFSISSAPEDLPRLEFTIKALGDFTATVRDITPGEPAFVDGPYGVFSVDRHPDAPGFVFVAGGVGMTPIMSMLRSLAARGDRRPLWLFYANPTWDEVLFREELEGLNDRLDLTTVHVLETAPEGWSGETGLIGSEMLERHLPAGRCARFEYFLCGPPPMIAAVEGALTERGVPHAQVRSEVFEFV